MHPVTPTASVRDHKTPVAPIDSTVGWPESYPDDWGRNDDDDGELRANDAGGGPNGVPGNDLCAPGENCCDDADCDARTGE